MEKLKFINEQMEILEVPYEFGDEWTSKVTYPYFTGEITEIPTMSEDGYEESEMILTGFHRGKGAWFELETIKNTIKKHFDPDYGLRASTDSGTIAVFFNGSFPVPTGEAELKRVQINLLIKEWRKKGDM